MNDFIMSGGNSMHELNFETELDLNQQSKTTYHTTPGKSPFGFRRRQCRPTFAMCLNITPIWMSWREQQGSNSS